MSELTGTAATVVLLRDSDTGPEVLLLERPTAGSFGGAWVFPGGRVDPEDRVDTASEADAARLAGVRETAEETGLSLHPDALVPLSCWIPPENIPRRYQTWFFAAAAPEGTIRLNPGELLNYLWLTPEDALERHRNGLMQLVTPTWVTLFNLCGGGDDGARGALARIADTEPETFRTRRLDGYEPVTVFAWEGDAEYDGAGPGDLGSGDLGSGSTASGVQVSGGTALCPSRHRLVMDGTHWHYERTS